MREKYAEQAQSHELQYGQRILDSKKRVDLNVLLGELKFKKKYSNKIKLKMIVSSILVAFLFYLFLKG